MNIRPWATGLLLLVLGQAAAWAQTARLDDSTSPRAMVQADLVHAQPLDAYLLRMPMGRVTYRLATAPYQGRRARIYYVVPMHVQGLRSPADLRVEWRTGGLFAPGSARPGMRVPVWTGAVTGPWMNESLDLDFIVDARGLQGARAAPLSFESYFEIEVLP